MTFAKYVELAKKKMQTQLEELTREQREDAQTLNGICEKTMETMIAVMREVNEISNRMRDREERMRGLETEWETTAEISRHINGEAKEEDYGEH